MSNYLAGSTQCMNAVVTADDLEATRTGLEKGRYS
jgi:hypothetical protein